MAYCTLDDILAAMDEQDVIRFSNDSAIEAETPDSNVLASAMDGATAIIDSFISGRYGALTAPVPELIVSLAVDISLYKLTGRKGDAPDEYRARYEDAVKMLERISTGKADIPGVIRDDDTVTGTDDPAAAVVSQSSCFSGTGTGLAGY